MSTKIKTPDGWKDVAGGKWIPQLDWDNAVNIGTAIGTAAGYTVPGPGMIVCCGHAAVSGIYCTLRLNNTTIGYDFSSTASTLALNTVCPVTQEDIIKHINYSNLQPVAVIGADGTDIRFSYKFVPYKD